MFTPNTVTCVEFTERDPLEADAGERKEGENPERVSTGRYVKVKVERTPSVEENPVLKPELGSVLNSTVVGPDAKLGDAGDTQVAVVSFNMVTGVRSGTDAAPQRSPLPVPMLGFVLLGEKEQNGEMSEESEDP